MALGTPNWVAIRKIVWKAAGAGLLTGGLLAFARISGETAPLIFTAFGNLANSIDLLHPVQTFQNLGKPIGALPLTIYQKSTSTADSVALAWTGALIISFSVLAINIIGRVIAAGEQRRS